MTRLTTDAKTADPRAVLADIKGLRRFADVPVLIVDPDDLPPGTPDHIERYLLGRVAADTPFALQHYTQHISPQLSMTLAVQRDLQRMVMPSSYCPHPATYAHLVDEDEYRPAIASVVIAPGSDFTPDKYFRASYKRSRNGLAPLLQGDDAVILHHFVLRHELAHTSGAAEPQADHIASLFTRRAFPESIVPAVVADMRAVSTIKHAFDAAAQAYTNRKLNHGLHSYNWGMVHAHDRAASVMPGRIAAMTDADIIGRRFDSHRSEAGPVMELGDIMTRKRWFFLRSKYADTFNKPHFNGIVEAAGRLAGDITRLTSESAIHAITARFAAAAARLEQGFTAYKKPVVIDLQAAEPRPGAI
jgi:hypothetical protein